jgi:hypothetical protein
MRHEITLVFLLSHYTRPFFVNKTKYLVYDIIIFYLFGAVPETFL